MLDGILESGEDWLKKRNETEGAEGLWRIGDELYDLEEFAKRHPGGERWIRITKGVDITTAFYAHHVTSAAEDLLPSLRVRAAKKPSTEPYTFRPDGFYMTLRRRVRDVLREKADVVKALKARTKLLADVLLLCTLLCASMAARTENILWAILGGVFLAYTGGVSHNFFHQKMNFRRLYFDLTFMASREWQISHGLSHHLYPNTNKDLEVTVFRPIFEFLPVKSKTFSQRYLSVFIAPFVCASAAHMQMAKRLNCLKLEDAVTLLLPAVMLLAGGSLYTAWKMWTLFLITSSTYFTAQGLTAGHHHPGLFHEGDTPREDTDWGLNQLDATTQRSEFDRLSTHYPNLAVILELTHFGNHRLHHLFPTIDGWVLPLLEETYEKTLKEMGHKEQHFIDEHTTWALIKGKFQQLSRNWRNVKARGSA